MLSVIILSVIMLSVIMLSVIMLIVVAPSEYRPRTVVIVSPSDTKIVKTISKCTTQRWAPCHLVEKQFADRHLSEKMFVRRSYELGPMFKIGYIHSLIMFITS
jgi:hypothetical protein